MSKKVILIIVEGPTEETVFYEFLEQRFDQSEVRIDVQHGDVLSVLSKQSIKNSIGQLIKDYLSKYKLLASDLVAVVHFTDADGCFIPNEFIQIAPEQTTRHKYGEDAIYVANEQRKTKIEERNKLKSNHMKVLASNKDFMINKISVPYQLFYFSTNLDHVLWDERNAVKEEKMDKAEEFLENLEEPIETFFWRFLTLEQGLSYEDKVKTSWDQLMEELNSLQRSTNMPLMFEMIERLHG